MSCNVNEYLNELEEKRDEISSIGKEIEDKRREYEEIIGQLNAAFNNKRKEIANLKKIVISVRLGDLIDELSWLSGVSVDDICVSIKFNRDFSNIDEMFKLIDEVRNDNKSYFVNNVRFRLWTKITTLDNSFVSFDYFAFLRFDMNSLQRDGKKLIEHCLSNNIEPYTNGELSVEFSVEKDFQDIICDFNLGYLEMKDNTSWYPTDLFRQAIINCSQRSYNIKVDKIRERVRNNKFKTSL